MKNKSIYQIIIIVLVLGIMTALYFVITKPKPGEGAVGGVPALTVQTVHPQKMKFQTTEAAYGFIQPWQEIVIGMELQGLRVQKVLVEPGDSVKQGQVLATFDATLVKADLANAMAQATQAQAQLREAQTQLEAANRVGGSGALSKVQETQYRSAAESARAQLQAAQAQVAKNQYWLKQTQVVAPYSGIISARSITPGQDLNTGSELFRMIREERLEWQGEVHARQVAEIQKSGKVGLELESGEKIYGTVRQVSPSIDREKRTAIAYVDVAVPPPMREQVRAGMFAKGIFQTGEKEVQVVPQSAVSWRDGFAWLMVVDANQTVQQLQVNLGDLYQGYYEITSELDQNLNVIQEGAGFLSPGDKVRIESAAPSEGQ